MNKELYDAFGVTEYHARGIRGSRVIVYVIDTGLMTVHPDVAHVIVEDYTGTAGSTSDHGSAVCALLSARENDYGIVGVAPDATVYLADVDDANTEIFDSAVAQALYMAYLRNADIVSISLSTTTSSERMRRAVKLCVDAGILVFAAAGNSGRVQYEYPASYPGVISVGSCNFRKEWSRFSTRNDRISIVAPGELISLPDGAGGFKLFSGTSFAAPFAAGLAALDLSEQRPSNVLLSRQQTIELLGQSMGTTLLAPQTLTSDGSHRALAVVLGVLVVILAVAIVGRHLRKS